MGPTRGTRTKLFVKFISVVGEANTASVHFNNVSEVDTRCGGLKGSGPDRYGTSRNFPESSNEN